MDKQDTKERELVITAKTRTEKNPFGGGFLQEWITGENDEVEFSIRSGAGLGNPYLTLRIHHKGSEEITFEDMDIRKVAETWVNSFLDEERAS
jgi:hypothetical protein